MTSSSHTTNKVHPEPPLSDLFDLLPDPILLLILNYLADVKSLGRCSLLSKRFHSLIPQVQNVVVRVDCVIPDDPSSPSPDKPRNPFSSLIRLLSDFVKPITHFLSHNNNNINNNSNNNNNSNGSNASVERSSVGVTHHSPTQVLKNFDEIKFLKIELPSGELGIDDDVLLKWKADFGSTLDKCVILGASSVISPQAVASGGGGDVMFRDVIEGNDDNNNIGGIPESFYTNGGLKLRVVWTISSLIAASARHYLLQQIISEHKTLDSLVLTDAERQGVLCMNKEQLEELRVKPLSASLASKRTLVPALNMKLWYAPYLELPNGSVLKGATLVAIRPSGEMGQKEVSDGSWVSSAFEEPYGTAARMLVKRRTYCLEMNSF